MSTHSDTDVSHEKRSFKKPTMPNLDGEWLTQILLYLNLSVFAMAGAIARQGITLLTVFTGSYSPSGLLWCNFAGCLLYGWLEDSHIFSLIEDQKQVPRRKIPLWVGMGPGFCGSMTSFSSIMLEAFLFGANQNIPKADYPDAGYGVQSVMAVGLIHYGLSFAGLEVGHHLADFLPIPPMTVPFERAVSFVIGCCSIALFCLFIIFAALWKSWRTWMYLGLWALAGANFRFQFSRLNRLGSGKNPWGTFTSNLIATLILAIGAMLQMGKVGDSALVTNVVQCQIIGGIANGFCAALSTVNDMVDECYHMSYKRAYVYAWFTNFFGFSLMILVLGSFTWTNSLTAPHCAYPPPDAPPS
ncbi:UPF0695 membrane protein [Yarrowia sp. B02]|nr:UPF0695 membrane protein [Yarrowia sp. B02]